MMNYAFDSESFIIDGKRVWLYVGEIHYYRFPREEWRRALETARACGLNTVSTYVAWNYHELTEGSWDFTGDRDLAHFIDLAKELGLYVMLRPGPYICGEWTGGGIPAWLLPKEGLEQRTDEPIFMEYTEKWLRKFMEIAAPRQVTRGGNVVSIQNDNEYHGGWDKRTSDYIEKVTNILRDAGCEVAVTACNCHVGGGHMLINYGAKMYDPKLYDRLNMPVTYNTCTDFDVVYELREYQKGRPTILSELWTGPMVFWQKPVPGGMDDDFVARCIIDSTLRHAMVTMYMFIGGTNHGFNAASNIATSYSSAYPVGDGLKPREKYYFIKPFGAFLSCYGEAIAPIPDERIPASDGAAARFATERGGIVILTGDKKSTRVRLGGEERCIRLVPAHGGALADGLKAGNATIDWASLFVLAEAQGALILYGNAGDDYEVSVNGKAYTGLVRTAPQLVEADGVKLMILDWETAKHTWILDGKVILGGDFAFGDAFEAGEAECVYELAGGELTVRCTEPAPAKPALPTLSRWEKRCPLEGSEFAAISKPIYHEKLGALNGYVWYRGHIHSDCERTGLLTAPTASTRVVALVNGVFAGEIGERRTENERFNYANPADRLRERIGVQLKQGDNEILLLSEDTGRCCLDSKPLGIEGDVYVDSRLLTLEDAIYIGKTDLTNEAADYLYSAHLMEARPVDTLSWKVTLAADEKLWIVVQDSACYVTVNGKPAWHPNLAHRPWQSFGGSMVWNCYLPECSEGENEIILQCPGSVEDVLSHAQAFLVKDSDCIGDWSWCALNENVPYEGRCDYESAAAKENKLLVPFAEVPARGMNYRPAFYTTSFELEDTSSSLFISMGSMIKGQIYVNGRNIGRFLRCPAQSRYYIPAAWLKKQNVITIFEEYGIEPDGVALSR